MNPPAQTATLKPLDTRDYSNSSEGDISLEPIHLLL